MHSDTTFYQVAATLLGTLLISGVIAEVRLHRDAVHRLRGLETALFVLAVGAFFVGEFGSIAVLLNAPPTTTQQTIVGLAVLVCAGAVVTLVLTRFAIAKNDQLSIRRFAAYAVTTVLICVVGALYVRTRDNELYRGGVGVAARAQCPGFTGSGGIRAKVREASEGVVYALPRVHSTELEGYAPGCYLSFRGACVGSPEKGQGEPLPDSLWLVMADGHGVMPSYEVSASLSSKSELIRCKGELPTPSHVKIIAPAALTTPVTTFRVAAQNAAFIGLAAWLSEAPPERRWQRIGADVDPQAGEPVTWLLERVPRRPVVVLADACYMAGFPSNADSFEVYGQGESISLSQSEREEGAETACQAPTGNELPAGSVTR